MQGIFRLITYILIFLSLGLGGMDVFRVIQLNIEIEREMQQMLEDAVEVSLDDTRLRSNISYIDPVECQNEFIGMVKTKYNLKNGPKEDGKWTYLPKENIFIEKFAIETNAFSGNDFSSDITSYRTQAEGDYPWASAEGEITIEPMFLRFNDLDYTLIFDVKVDNYHFENRHEVD